MAQEVGNMIHLQRLETWASVLAGVIRFVVALATILMCSSVAQACLVAAGMSAWILFESEGHDGAGVMAWLGCVCVAGVVA